MTTSRGVLFNAALCNTCKTAITDGWPGVRWIGYEAVAHTHTPKPGTIARADVWDLGKALIGAYPTVADLTDGQYQIAAEIEAFLAVRRCTWIPSRMLRIARIARAVHSTVDAVGPVLQYMAGRGYVIAAGRGARTRYAINP